MLIRAFVILLFTVFILVTANASECAKYDRKVFEFDSRSAKSSLLAEQGISKRTWGTVAIDAYTGRLEDAYVLESDHIIPLKWAWDKGACNWSKSDQVIFANDLDNLALTHMFHNRSKGAKGIDHWTPIGTEFDERYTSIWNKAYDKYFKQ